MTEGLSQFTHLDAPGGGQAPLKMSPCWGQSWVALQSEEAQNRRWLQGEKEKTMQSLSG